ncbi:hypothetical protein SRO_3995 [Streptomyces rochei]|nr:hypothetical protein SRO_3995 [Streptomyces rochei]
MPCPPYRSVEGAIDSFAATARCLGVRLETGGEWVLYAPCGLDDVFGLVLRSHPVLAPREVYEAKAARWAGEWPELTVLPWSG